MNGAGPYSMYAKAHPVLVETHYTAITVFMFKIRLFSETADSVDDLYASPH